MKRALNNLSLYSLNLVLCYTAVSLLRLAETLGYPGKYHGSNFVQLADILSMLLGFMDSLVYFSHQSVQREWSMYLIGRDITKAVDENENGPSQRPFVQATNSSNSGTVSSVFSHGTNNHNISSLESVASDDGEINVSNQPSIVKKSRETILQRLLSKDTLTRFGMSPGYTSTNVSSTVTVSNPISSHTVESQASRSSEIGMVSRPPNLTG